MNKIILPHFVKVCDRFYHTSALIMSVEKSFNDAKEIFQAAIKSVQPKNLINKTVKMNSNFIQIQGEKIYVSKNAHIVGFGKAVLGMARELERKLNDHLISGIVSIPDGFLNSASIDDYDCNSLIQVYEGACNNIPDRKSEIAAIKISKLVASLKEEDILFVLISGGGSALLPSPKPPITLNEKIKVIKLLASKGASIEEINAVRKRLSTLKGGGLAQLAKPAKVVSLILSDIVGDPLGLIASGPTVENQDDPLLPLTIIEKYHLKNELPSSVLQLLQNITVKNELETFGHVNNFIIGNNQTALNAAALASQSLNYLPCILTNALIGQACKVGVQLVSLIAAVLQHDTKLAYQTWKELRLSDKSYQLLLDCVLKLESEKQKLCILLGGETTVEVHGLGVGGRNQELALAAAIELKNQNINQTLTLLSAGTDGIDGPTDAAGAIATTLSKKLIEMENFNASQFLNDNDSYTFFSRFCNSQFHVKTGHTGTNVMDIIVILIN